MARDLKEFWQHFQSGLEVAVAGSRADKLLGVRDGFLRYFHGGLEQAVPVAVVPQGQEDEDTVPLPLSDHDCIALASDRARALHHRLGATYGFYVGVEAGLVPLEVSDPPRHFVRCWAVLRGLDDETWGSSGSIQLPLALTSDVATGDLPFAVPGRRRRDGMVASLTGGLETRRMATALATFNAVASLMYGLIERRSEGRWPLGGSRRG